MRCPMEVHTLQSRLMRSQGTKHLLCTHKQPLETRKDVVFSGVVPYPASSGNASLPRESGK